MMASGLRALALAMLLGVAVGCGHNEEEACDALPASTEASADGAVMYSVSVEGDAPIRLPPVDLITERVLALRALTESPDVDGARAALRRYLKGGEITLTPEQFEGRETYVARADLHGARSHANRRLVHRDSTRQRPSRGPGVARQNHAWQRLGQPRQREHECGLGVARHRRPRCSATSS